MKTLDELVADKILDLVHYVLLKFIKPDMTLSKVNELDIQAIEKLIWNWSNNFRRRWHIAQENERHSKM